MSRVTFTSDDPLVRRSITAVREWLGRELFFNKNEAECPCCLREAKLYKRKFDRVKAYALMVFAARLKVNEWSITPSFLKSIRPDEAIAALEQPLDLDRGREWTRLQLWGLIERQGTKADEEERSVYRLTPLGAAVARGATVPLTVALFDGTVREKSTEETTVEEILGVPAYQKLRAALSQP